MKKKIYTWKNLRKIIMFSLLFFPIRQIYAIPPPDFIIQIVSNFGVYFAMWFAFIASFFWGLFFYIKTSYTKNKLKYIFILIIFIISIFFLYRYLREKEDERILLQKNTNINTWINYEDPKILEQNKWLSYEEKVKLLLSIEEKELKNWLFWINNSINTWTPVTNQELEHIIKTKNSQYTILDAREDIEYEIWNIPWSIHYRLADLKIEEDWKNLSKSQTYVVICWSWMRWKLVSEYLISKWFNAKYLKWWIEDWIKFWWVFNWETELEDVFKDSNYNNFLSKSDFLYLTLSWSIVIDARAPDRLSNQDKLDYVDKLSIMYTSSKTLNTYFETYKNNPSPLVVVCNDYINCFDAELIWLELEKVKANFKWIYFKK